MKQYFAIYKPLTGEFFTDSDWNYFYFEKENPRLFNTHEEALRRLNEEIELFPHQEPDSIFTIIPVYKKIV